MKIKNILIIIILFITTACGFSRMYQNIDLSAVDIKKINFEGPNNIIFYLKSKLSLKENKLSKNGKTLFFKISESIQPKNKNSAGIIIEETIKVEILMEIRKDNKFIAQDIFSGERNVILSNNLSNDNERKITEMQNIVNDISQQIVFSIQSNFIK